MLNGSAIQERRKRYRNQLREEELWHDRGYTPSLGCDSCNNLDTCGGLRIAGAFYECLDLCCHEPEKCDAVCRIKPREFVRSVREIGGFRLDNIPRVRQPPPAPPALPPVVPVLYHGKRRRTAFAPPSVCLSLYSVIPRHDHKHRFTSPKTLAEAFRFQFGTPIILTGTDTDAPLERWWSLGSGRLSVIRHLRDLGVNMVTTPNYSLFTDVPRWDNLQNIKRIGITHEEFLREGIPAALHVNARTERDWDRWTEYIFQRNEITHIAFEFITGAGRRGRADWHTNHLVTLAESVGRPLHLVLRAAKGNGLPLLDSAFAQTTLLDTQSFFKAVHRQRAVETDGRLRWEPFPTDPDAPVDELLEHNWSHVKRSYDPVFDTASNVNSRI